MLSSLWLTIVLMSGGFQYSILFSVEISRGMCPLHTIIGEQKSGDISCLKLWGNKRRGTDTPCEVITLVYYYFTSQVKEDQKDWLSNKLQTLISFFLFSFKFFPYFFQMSIPIHPHITFVTILFLYLLSFHSIFSQFLFPLLYPTFAGEHDFE
jgi:hypothetical protein